MGSLRAADSSAVAQITALVGKLPLAVRLVGRYLAENEENAIDYLTWFSGDALSRPQPGATPGRERASCFLARSLAQVSEQAGQVLGVIGLLALAPFTWEIVLQP